MWIWVRCMANGAGGMRESFCNGDHLGYGKFLTDRILTGFFMPEMDGILSRSISV